jgi:hypothetical protein
MRTILIAGLTVVGIGFAATSGASAAPVNSAALAALATDHVTTVQYYGGYRTYGYNSYGYNSYGYNSYRGYGYSRYGYGRRW